MAKSITEQIEDLQQENERLREYEKLFEKALKNEFGIGRKSIHKKLAETDEKSSGFEGRICSFFGLTSDADKDEFLSIMCSDSSLRFFYGKREKVTAAE